jgi:hypothetical protein
VEDVEGKDKVEAYISEGESKLFLVFNKASCPEDMWGG